MASHWVVMDTIVQWAIDHYLTICLIFFIGMWPVGLFMFWTLAKIKGMTLKEYMKKRVGGSTDYHSGGGD